MATIVNIPRPKNDLGTALGTGIGSGISQASTVGLEQILKEREGREFQEKLSALKNAGDRKSALNMVVTGGIARTPDELIKLTSAIDTLYPQEAQGDRIETPVVDKDTGTVTRLQLTPEQINSPQALAESFPGRNFRLATESERKPTVWVDNSGDYIATSAIRPQGGMPLDVYKEQRKASGGGLKSDIFDEQGNLKNETSGEIRRMAQMFISESHPETGVPTRPDPKLLQSVIDRTVANLYKRHTQGEPVSVASAVSEAATRSLAELPLASQIPLSTKAKQKLGDRTVFFEEGIKELDRQLMQMGSSSGVVSGVKQLVNYISGATDFLDVPLAFKDTARSRAQLRAMKQTLTVALADPGDDRISDSERKIIRDMIPGPDDWIKDPEQSAEELRVLRELLARRRQFAIKRLGLKGVDALPTREEILIEMPKQEIININASLLNESERQALSNRLDQLGVK